LRKVALWEQETVKLLSAISFTLSLMNANNEMDDDNDKKDNNNSGRTKAIAAVPMAGIIVTAAAFLLNFKECGF
jgi:hypothetical protein